MVQMKAYIMVHGFDADEIRWCLLSISTKASQHFSFTHDQALSSNETSYHFNKCNQNDMVTGCKQEYEFKRCQRWQVKVNGVRVSSFNHEAFGE